VTELLEGETLRARIAGGPLPVRKAIDYAAQIAEGLSAAHDKGIVHRDLKPENLFVTREDRVKILDFGLARQTIVPGSDDTSSPTLSPGTEPGTVMGTVGYMSPEQVRGLPADARSDIFSFGAVLYEMVSGRRAFQGESAAETMHAILKEEPADLLEPTRALPLALERIVSHCLEKRPEQRFRSAHDLAFDLRALPGAPWATRGSHPTATRSSTTRPGGASPPRYSPLASTAESHVPSGCAPRWCTRSPPRASWRLVFSAGSVVAVDRNGAKRTLSNGWADLYGLAWRPDGREVWFTAARRGEFKALRAVTLAGEERLVARVMGQLDLEDISRDGRVLVGHPNFRIDMVARAPGESKERELTWLGLSQVADLSEDGSEVLFTEFPEGEGEGARRTCAAPTGLPRFASAKAWPRACLRTASGPWPRSRRPRG
jgi:hypothetical protein